MMADRLRLPPLPLSSRELNLGFAWRAATFHSEHSITGTLALPRSCGGFAKNRGR
jgi:hypothetical protein